MLRRIHDPDRGASFVEYAGVILLVAAILSAVVLSDIPGRVGSWITGATQAPFSAQGPGTNGGSDPRPTTGNGAPQPTPGQATPKGGQQTAPPPQPGSDGDDQGDGWVQKTNDVLLSIPGHVGDYVVGAFQGLAGDVTGLGDVFTQNPVTTVKQSWAGIKEDPWSLLISKEARDAWGDGEYGKAIGLGHYDIGTWFVPGAGWAAKAGKLGKLGKLGTKPDKPDKPEKPTDDKTHLAEGEKGKEKQKGSCKRSSFVSGARVLSVDGSAAQVDNLKVDDLHTIHVSQVRNSPLSSHNQNSECGDLGDDWEPLPPSEICDSTGCEVVARNIQNEIGGKRYRIRDAYGAPFLGKYRGEDTNWDYHDVVIKDGRVYDAFSGRNGVPLDEYRNLWQYGEDLRFHELDD